MNDASTAFLPCMVRFLASAVLLAYSSLLGSLSGLCSLDQPDHCFQAYAVLIEKTNSRTARWYGPCKEEMEYDLYHQ
jgi:hypothetical protein